MRPALVALAAAVLLVSCSDDHPLAALADAADGEVINVSEEVEFSWDRLHVFGPYTPLDTVRAYLGDHPAVARYRPENEGQVLIAYTDSGRVLLAYSIPRHTIDLAPASRPSGYTREQARFRITREGYRRIVRPL